MSKRILLVCMVILVGVMPILAGCTSKEEKAEIATLKADAALAAANKAVLQKFLGYFKAGTWDKFSEVFAEDCVLHEPGGLDVVGLEAIKALWAGAFAPLKSMKTTKISEMYVGEYMMIHMTWSADYTGEFMGQQFDGVPVKYDQAETVHFVDGKIVEYWVTFDKLRMAEELGFALISSEEKAEVAKLQADAAQVAEVTQVWATLGQYFAAGTWDKFNEVFSEDCVLHEPGGADYVGVDAIRGCWATAFAPMENMKIKAISQAYQGEYMLIAATWTADYTGEFMGQQFEAVPVEYNQIESIHVVDGKIAEFWVVYDKLRMAEELGFELTYNK